MSMGGTATFRHLLRHEWRMLQTDRASWLVLALLTLALGYGVFNGARWTGFQHQTLAAARAEQDGRYARIRQQVIDIETGRLAAPFADPRMPDMAGGRLAWTYATMPPLPVASLSIGQSDVLPYYFRVSTASRETVLTTSEIENPQQLLHGRFDLSFVVIYLLPLLVIALGFNLISLEREEGTLALLLSQPVSLRTLLLAKVGLRAALLVLVVVALSVAGVVATGEAPLDPASRARLAAWTITVIAYGAFWVGMLMLATSLGRSSATNALALMTTWLLLVVVVPSTLNMSVSALYPIPSRAEMISAVRAATDEATARGGRLLARYYGDHPELAGGTDVQTAAGDAAVIRLAIDEEVARRTQPVVDRYDAQLSCQQMFVDGARFLSPAILAQDAMNEAAGTGASRYRHFVAEVADYHRRWRTLISVLLLRQQKMSVASYDELPQFVHQEPPAGEVEHRVLTAAAILLGAGAVLTLVALARLRRFPIVG